MAKSLFSLIGWMLTLSVFALDVTDLRTEDMRNPIGIDQSNIHLSWMLQSSQRAVLQTAYSIQIARDASFGDVVWESGTISSTQSVDVEARGFNPAPETRYYWRVTVSDNKGETATSTEKAYFETGLTKADAGIVIDEGKVVFDIEVNGLCHLLLPSVGAWAGDVELSAVEGAT